MGILHKIKVHEIEYSSVCIIQMQKILIDSKITLLMLMEFVEFINKYAEFQPNATTFI